MRPFTFALTTLLVLVPTALAQSLITLDHPTSPTDFPIAANNKTTAIYVAPQNPETVRTSPPKPSPPT